MIINWHFVIVNKDGQLVFTRLSIYGVVQMSWHLKSQVIKKKWSKHQVLIMSNIPAYAAAHHQRANGLASHLWSSPCCLFDHCGNVALQKGRRKDSMGAWPCSWDYTVFYWSLCGVKHLLNQTDDVTKVCQLHKSGRHSPYVFDMLLHHAEKSNTNISHTDFVDLMFWETELE